MKKKYKLTGFLRNKIRWSCVQRVIHDIGETLNSRENRFDKSGTFAEAIDYFSYGTMKYVDEPGRDLKVIKTKEYVEFKFQKNSITKSDGTIKDHINGIKLFNSLGTNTYTRLPEDYAEYIIIQDRYCAIGVTKIVVSEYIKVSGDGISVNNLPISKCDILFYKKIDYPASSKYAENKRESRRNYIASFDATLYYGDIDGIC